MEKPSDVFNGIGVPIDIGTPENFLKIKETLTRVGIATRDNTLYQSCHILHKRGLYAIVHFKEMFILDGRTADLTEDDIGRRNTIVDLLAQWGLISVLDQSTIQSPRTALNKIKVVKFRDKGAWTLVAKYNIGRGD